MAERATIERYVGLPYVPGVFDCADLVQRVLREVWGREIALPQDRNRPTGLREQAREIEGWIEHLVRERDPMLLPQDGDGVLLAVGSLPRHIGIACWIDRELYVLHNNSAATGSVLTRWRNLKTIGFEVHGVFEWI